MIGVLGCVGGWRDLGDLVTGVIGGSRCTRGFVKLGDYGGSMVFVAKSYWAQYGVWVVCVVWLIGETGWLGCLECLRRLGDLSTWCACGDWVIAVLGVTGDSG